MFPLAKIHKSASPGLTLWDRRRRNCFGHHHEAIELFCPRFGDSALMLSVFWKLMMQNPTRIPKRFLGKFQCSSSESLIMAPVTSKLPEQIVCLRMKDFFVSFLLDQISQPAACGTVSGLKIVWQNDSIRTWWLNQNQPGGSGCHPRRSRPFLWKLSRPLTYELYFLLFLCVCLPHVFNVFPQWLGKTWNSTAQAKPAAVDAFPLQFFPK